LLLSKIHGIIPPIVKSHDGNEYAQAKLAENPEKVRPGAVRRAENPSRAAI